MFKFLKKKLREEWHYTCINGHKWTSRYSPSGNAKNGCNMFGEPCTRCPKCKTEVCQGQVYRDGECKGVAIHIGFIEK